jgi:hypothetical protein
VHRAPLKQLKRFAMNTTDIVNTILASRNTTAAALERVRPELQALDANDVRLLKVDVPTAVSRALGAAPKIRGMRAEIVSSAPNVDVERLDKLEDYAYALQEAHVRYLGAGKSPDELRALGAEGDTLRILLRSDAVALVNRGLIDPACLASCTGLSGYKTIATELGILSAVMISNWSKIQCKCGVTEQDLKRATTIGGALLAYVGLREQSPEMKAAAMDLRDRAFTLLANTYDLARRVVTFLRWDEDDADLIAPTLFGGKRRSEKNVVDAQAEPATPTPEPTPAVTPAAGNGAASPQASVNVAVGRPNSNPFMQ